MTTTLSPTTTPSGTPRRRVLLAVGAVLIAAAIAAAAMGALSRGGGSDASAGSGAPALQLSAGEGDSLASCLAFEVPILAQMSPAFAATATGVEGETVRLAVDRWYAGDPGTDVVELHAPAGLESLIAGFPFAVGQQYLITAANGTVNYCGYSGIATPELSAAFEQAFGQP